MKPILDATAGNRRMWRRGDRGYNLDIVYLDMEYELAVPPTVFADNEQLPFRDDCFSLVIYDPPYHVNSGPSAYFWIFWNPAEKHLTKTNAKKLWPPGHYGLFRSKRKLVKNVWKSAREFHRVAHTLCFKWGEGTLSLWNTISLILHEGWKEIYRYNRKGRGNRGKSKLYWVTFKREITDAGD